MSSEELQTAIAAVQQKVSALSNTGFLPDTTLVTWITGNVEIKSMRVQHVLLSPLLLAPAENVELAIRNYWNGGGLSVSNANGRVSVASGITLGGL